MGPLALFPALAFLVLAAHFYRAGNLVLAAACLLFLPLLVVPRRWASFLLRTGLVAGTIVWIRTATSFAGMRAAAGQPWTRLAVILGAVSLATGACLLVFRSERVKAFFGLSLS